MINICLFRDYLSSFPWLLLIQWKFHDTLALCVSPPSVSTELDKDAELHHASSL